MGADEIQSEVKLWIKREKQSSKLTKSFERDRLQLNLITNNEGILECEGSIQGQYPIYIPESHPFTVKIELKPISELFTEEREQQWRV